MQASHERLRIQLPTRPLQVRWAIGVVSMWASALLSNAAAQSTVIDIPVPRQAEWTTTVLRDAGPATVRASTRNAGNNEIFMWQIDFIAPASAAPFSSNDSLAMLYNLQGWDPATQGGIAQIDIAMDIDGVFSSFADGVTGSIRPVVTQGGQIYSVFGSGVSINVDTVGPTLWSLHASDDWVRIDAGTGLDLTRGGAPLLFGFRYDLGTNCAGATGCKAAGAVTTVSSLRYEIHPVAAAVPEPATWAMLLAGAALVGMRIRRKPHKLALP